ncbi:methyltransferase domain-containing protein [Scytonema sp. UIC 10036]|uniref:SAM-dependent methyltransferase n=1 Tax=Scytonema sp. UIC 10036 TaxID=2304196 RepID=UPI0012DA8F20|nr:class I SAM-dependent methyltransferase [Scytonema sp. UIC 10036]MUG94905.1 methyltransferase domain-containing protein [Scytonema sp. UIC 10036]
MLANSLLKIFLVTMSVGSLLVAGCTQQTTSEFNTNPATTNSNTVEVQQSTPESLPNKGDPDYLDGAFYEPTPQAIVDKMLKIAKVGKDDILYDLGSGDGRIPITAAKKFGARGVGIDINPELVKTANENAKNAGVTDKVKFLQQDIFKSDFRDATVVTLYLDDGVNIKLRPQLFKQLKPGTRVVSFQHHMGDWVDYEHIEEADCQPEDNCSLEDKHSVIYMWKIPENVPENLRPDPNIDSQRLK